MLEFPCDFSFKIFGRPSDEFKLTVVSSLTKHFANFDVDRDLHANYSSEKNYCAYTATVHAISQQQLDDCYRELSADPLIVMVL